ncbi:MAG: TGS domain-containing protein, partial [Eggerthellaceae bacterium]|nr:TGS domain-containing protein [Eggerthellaceae bacterium]
MEIVLPDGSTKSLQQGANVGDVAASVGSGLAKAALAGIVNGAAVDLSAAVAEGDQVAIITNKSPEALDLLRHSAAHILAHALEGLYPGIEFGVGPAIENGFYYDVKLDQSIGLEDL